jgi:hypothetical protein
MYVRLVFGSGAELTLFEWPELHRNRGRLGRDDSGYADALIDLVYATVTGARESAELGIVLDLDDGSRLTVSLSGSDDGYASLRGATFRGRRTAGLGVWGPVVPSARDQGAVPGA